MLTFVRESASGIFFFSSNCWINIEDLKASSHDWYLHANIKLPTARCVAQVFCSFQSPNTFGDWRLAQDTLLNIC